MTRVFGFIVLAILLLCFFIAVHKSSGQELAQETPKFDYYILSLSWSPEYCQTHKRDNSQQCSEYRTFVLHGLWPEWENGGHPGNCEGDDVPEAIINDMLPYMPSEHLIIHEWETHGTCSGLKPFIYFRNAKNSFNNITIPKIFQAPTKDFGIIKEDIVSAFKKANSGLQDNAIEVTCHNGNELAEVRFALDKNGKSRVLTVNDNSCRDPIKVIAPRD